MQKKKGSEGPFEAKKRGTDHRLSSKPERVSGRRRGKGDRGIIFGSGKEDLGRLSRKEGG